MLPPIDRNSGNKPKEIQNAYYSKETHEGQYKERLGQLNMPNAPILMERGPYKQIGQHYMQMYNQKQHSYNSSEQIRQETPMQN